MDCAGISMTRFTLMSEERKANWKCRPCLENVYSNSNTPLSAYSSSSLKENYIINVSTDNSFASLDTEDSPPKVSNFINRSCPDLRYFDNERLLKLERQVKELTDKLSIANNEIENVIMENGRLKDQLKQHKIKNNKLLHICNSETKNVTLRKPNKYSKPTIKKQLNFTQDSVLTPLPQSKGRSVTPSTCKRQQHNVLLESSLEQAIDDVVTNVMKDDKSKKIHIFGDEQLSGLALKMANSRCGKWNDNYIVEGMIKPGATSQPILKSLKNLKMFVEQVSALATLISDITMSLHRPVEGFHAERYNIMLGFLSYTSNVLPNPLTQDNNRCLQSVNFLFSLVGHLFSQSTRIVPARLPGISIRDVQSCVMSLNRYMIDSHIFEIYSLKSDRIHLNVGSRGVVRIAGATGGSRTVFHDGRVAQGVLIPGSHIYKIGLESYTIITNIPRNIATPGYVMNTSLAYDSSMTVLIYDAAAQAIGSLVMGARPEVIVDVNTINEGLFVTCGAGTNIQVRPPPGMNAWVCAHLISLNSLHNMKNKISRDDVIILSVGSNDNDPYLLYTQLCNVLYEFRFNQILLMNVCRNKYLNVDRINSKFKLLSNYYENCKYIDISINSHLTRRYLNAACLTLNLQIDSKTYAEKYIINSKQSHVIDKPRNKFFRW